jgi:hypothetical protein
VDKIHNPLERDELIKFLQDGQKLMGQINRLYRKLDPNSTEYIRYQQILIWMLGAHVKIVNSEMDECVNALLQESWLQYTNDLKK